MPTITFIETDGIRRSFDAKNGDTILDVASRNNINLEGACEGEMACTTCHVIVSSEWFPRLKSATEEEEDMLDLATDLKATSRLGCQILLTDNLDGIVVSLPMGHHNFMSS
ncbi:MAG: 2Fe-2S iron-sulfur cluster-binding protein [Pseudomonadota bacterium]|nr:2Fe-2S iron-sulfur cluster-binding protein [Pseudomonadota bacterium]